MTLLWFLRGYFSAPFPRATGFSAYRTPGYTVHLPLIVMCVLIGLALADGGRAALPLVLMCLIVGVYPGRDVAIVAHYNPLITLAVWAGFFGVLIGFQRVIAFARVWTASLPAFPWLAMFGLVGAFAGYLGILYRQSRD
jgi:hypothetical protein